jgi:alkylation response protein AidB-like acyl-CoA dehydrogenase
MLVALEGARSCAYHAAWALADEDSSAPVAVSMAKAASSDMCRLVCNEALQIHGGVGFTHAFDVHWFMRRGKYLEHAFGDASWHRERVAANLLDASLPA